MKESIVTMAQYTRTWESPQGYGTFYVHSIMFENGDGGEYSAKTEKQDKFVTGQKAQYEITPIANYPDKIKPVAPDFQGGGKPSGSGKSFGDPKTMVLAYAKDLAVARIAAGAMKDVDIRSIAKDYVELMAVLEGTHTIFQSNSKPTEKATVENPPPPVVEDQLPF